MPEPCATEVTQKRLPPHAVRLGVRSRSSWRSRPSGSALCERSICGPSPRSVLIPVNALTRMPRYTTTRSGKPLRSTVKRCAGMQHRFAHVCPHGQYCAIEKTRLRASSLQFSFRSCALPNNPRFWRISRREQKFGNLVELPGSRPPGPKSRTAVFSRLSFEFSLLARTSRNRNFVRSSCGCFRAPLATASAS
jgi:hypothetical protein